jgi:uncharacterized protein (DUF697 family)
MFHQWLATFQAVGQRLTARSHSEEASEYDRYDRYDSERLFSWGRLFGRTPEILDAEAEVAEDQQGRVLLLSQEPTLAAALLSRFHGRMQPVTRGHFVREGFFTLVTLPPLTGDPQAEAVSPRPAQATGSFPLFDEGLWPEPPADAEELLDRLVQAASAGDLFLYLLDAESGWQATDAQWCTRLRVCDAPLLPVVLTKPGQPAPADLLRAAHHELGIHPLAVERLAMEVNASAPPHPEEAAVEIEIAPAAPLAPDVDELIRRMLTLRPRLALALAQAVPACRPRIAHRIIRNAAWMAALVGSEPIPLLDLPLQLGIQWKMALQLATIYGRPGLDYRSRELVGAVLMQVGVRRLVQQLIKLVPVLGWLLSGVFSGLSAWTLGQMLLGYYAEGRLLTLPPVRQALRSPRARLPRWWRPQPEAAQTESTPSPAATETEQV